MALTIHSGTPWRRLGARAAVAVTATALIVAGGTASAGAATPSQKILKPTTATPLPAAFTSLLASDLTGRQWSLQATHVAAAWTKATGAGVIVASIDTGVDRTRPDLKGRVLDGAHLDPDTGKIVAGYARDTYSHGTHTAGIIAGSNDGSGIAGVAPDATILPINLDTSDYFTGTDIAHAVDWAVAHDAQVINMSLGELHLAVTEDDVAPLCKAAAAAVAQGVVVVASAGNDGDYGSIPSAPADCPGVISVAAVNSDLKATTWSSYDGTVSVAAPGDAVLSTVPTATDPSGFALYSGTSMSAPFVTGVAALLVQEHPTWTPAQVKKQLQDTARDRGPAGVDSVYGHGVVDPAKAVGASAPAPTRTPFITPFAYPFQQSATSTDYDETLVTWRPDSRAVATGYTIDAYTPSGLKSYALDADATRDEIPVQAAGFVITEHTTTGDIVSAPVWSDPYYLDALAVLAPTHLKVVRHASGSLTITWKLPKADLTRADYGYVDLYGDVDSSEPCAFRVTKTTGKCTVPASSVPRGDFTVNVNVFSRATYGYAEATKDVAARVPFRGTYEKAGAHRVTVTLVLAKSWAKKACAKAKCSGVAVTVRSGKHHVRGYLTSSNTVTVTLKATVHRGKVRGEVRHYVTVSVTPVKGHKALKQKAFRIATT